MANMPSLFTHILVPVDFTEKNRAALDVAFQLASRIRSRITLLHVIEKVEYADDEETHDFYQMLEVKANNELAGMAQRFLDNQLTVDQQIVFGRRRSEIVRASLDRNVDLVLLSSHKIDLDKPPKDWGTLSYQVSVLCQCPVLLVK
jgi:nucleotide-binding universal stress UspA family protein